MCFIAFGPFFATLETIYFAKQVLLRGPLNGGRCPPHLTAAPWAPQEIMLGFIAFNPTYGGKALLTLMQRRRRVRSTHQRIRFQPAIFTYKYDITALSMVIRGA